MKPKPVSLRMVLALAAAYFFDQSVMFGTFSPTVLPGSPFNSTRILTTFAMFDLALIVVVILAIHPIAPRWREPAHAFANAILAAPPGPSENGAADAEA